MSNSREFLLGITIMFILGAWAASAQDGNQVASTTLDLNDYGIVSYTPKKFKIDDLTLWKTIQLQAVAMSAPESLSNFSIGSYGSFRSLAEKDGGDVLKMAIAAGIPIKVGVMDEMGVFTELVGSETCALVLSCDPKIWMALTEAVNLAGAKPVEIVLSRWVCSRSSGAAPSLG